MRISVGKKFNSWILNLTIKIVSFDRCGDFLITVHR
jgi:hypothetical protein